MAITLFKEWRVTNLQIPSAVIINILEWAPVNHMEFRYLPLNYINTKSIYGGIAVLHIKNIKNATKCWYP